jgi:hypothetical protein
MFQRRGYDPAAKPEQSGKTEKIIDLLPADAKNSANTL